MREIELSWSGPFEFTSERGRSLFLAQEGADAGVYVWGVRTSRGLIPHYVGETGKSFAIRHLEHFQSYATGVYSTREADAFVAGREVILCAGVYWRRTRISEHQQFIDGFAQFAAHVSKMLAAIEVFVAPLNADQRIRRRVEAGLASAFYHADAECLALFPPGYRRWKRRPDEESLLVSCNSVPPVMGFRTQFEA